MANRTYKLVLECYENDNVVLKLTANEEIMTQDKINKLIDLLCETKKENGSIIPDTEDNYGTFRETFDDFFVE